MNPLLGPLRLGRTSVWPPLLLAPMMDLTNRAFRALVRSYGGCGLYYSEMLSARRVPAEPDHAPVFRGFGAEPDLVVQLLGDDPKRLQAAVHRLEKFTPAGYDLNVGCTRAKVVCRGWGAALLDRPAQAAAAAASIRAATARTLTVKLRVPRDTHPKALAELARALVDAGADALIVHARTAERAFTRPARWEWIAAVKTVVSVPVIGNGDVRTADQALAMLAQTGCDGVMIGRGAVSRPCLFREIADRLEGRPTSPAPPPAEILDGMLRELGPHLHTRKGAKEFRTFCQYFAEGLPVPHWFWGPLQGLRRGGELAERARAFFRRTPEMISQAESVP